MGVDLRPVRRPEDIPALEELFAIVAEADGHAPIGEHKYLDLLGADPAKVTGVVGEEAGDIVAYVALAETADPDTVALELAVHPLHRRPGILDALLGAACGVTSARRIRAWAFQPNLAAALERTGFTPERELRQLRRPLPVGEEPSFPPTVTVRGFRPGTDEDAWLAVNNAAFGGHPENGGWTRDTLARRMEQPWFHPEAVRMAWLGDDLLGFCWTKMQGSDIGEIYVLAVSPRAPRLGVRLGRELALEGLRHLADEDGARTAVLYVDATNERALALYTALGFRLDHVDRSFLRLRPGG